MTAPNEGILLVETVESVGRLYQFWLQDAGYAVERATRPDAVSEWLPTQSDVVIVDRGVLESVSREPLADAQSSDGSLKIVLTLGVSPGPDVVALPFDDYLVEPVSRPELVDAIDRVLARRACDDVVDQFATAVNRVTLVRDGTTRSDRAGSDPYRSLVDRLWDLYETTASRLGPLDDECIATIFGNGEAAALARDPTDRLNVHTGE